MGRIKATGIDETLAELESLGKATGGAPGYSLYEGARVMADAVRAAAGGLPFKPSTVQQIQNAIGILPFKDTGDGTETSIGFEGYFSESNFPIPFFVREVEGGTSRMAARPFVRRTESAVRAQAEAAIQAAAQEFLERAKGG